MKQNTGRIKRNNRRNRSPRSRPGTSFDARLGFVRSYPGQQLSQLKVPIQPVPVVILAAGSIAQVLALNPSAVSGTQLVVEDWATRFELCFEEYRLVRADLSIIPVAQGGTPNSAGSTVCWFDEKSATVPTAQDANEHTTRLITNNPNTVAKPYRMVWRMADPLDTQYSPTNAGVTPVFLKFFSNSTYGNIAPTGSIGQQIFLVKGTFTIQFRGIASQVDIFTTVEKLAKRVRAVTPKFSDDEDDKQEDKPGDKNLVKTCCGRALGAPAATG